MPDDLLQGEISLTTAQIGVLYAPEANREMLHYLVKRKEAVTAALDPEKARMASSKTATRDSLRYDAKNLERLSTIFALRQAKFGLDEIVKELKSDPFGPEAHDWIPWKMLPPERVSAVNKNNRALLNLAVVRDAESMLRRAVENGLTAVESARCSIVLFTRDGNLLLRNDWSGLKDGEDPEAEHDQNRIMSEPKAEFRELRATEWAQWSKEPHIGVQPCAQPGKVRSRMQVPIVDNHKVKRGLVIWEDRLDSWRKHVNPIDSKIVLYDRVDLAIGRIFANGIASLLDSLVVTKGIERLRGMMLRTRTPALVELFQEVMIVSRNVLRCDRADLFWRDPDPTKDQLIYVCGDPPTVRDASGKSTTPFSYGDPLPGNSICAGVWKSGGWKIVRNVNDPIEAPDYHRCDGKTQSEIAIRLDSNQDLPLAVLNLESNDVGFFKEESDLPILQRFAEYATIAGRFAYRREDIYQQISGPSGTEGLAEILTSALYNTDFKEGLICISDPRRAVLRVAVLQVASREGPVFPTQNLEFPFEEQLGPKSRFPILVFGGDKGLTREENEGFDGLESMQPSGPYGTLYGAPLMFGSVAIGALIVWGPKEPLNPKALEISKRARLEAVEKSAKLAVTTAAILMTETTRRASFLSMQKILLEMQGEPATKHVLGQILQAIVASGFERVRCFVYDKDDKDNKKFRCIASYGVEKENWYAGANGGKVVELPILNDNLNPYFAMARENADAEAFEFRVCYPLGEETDKYAKEVDKPTDLPWAVGPLRVNKNFRGYVAADNRDSRRPISQANVDYLAVYTSLAALVLATGDQRETW